MRSISKQWLIYILLFAVSICCGCTPAKRVVYNVGLDAVPNPPAGSAVKIVKVTDAREFSSEFTKDGVPVMNRKEEIANPTITLRTIGRGIKNGDVIVPLSGSTTVETLVDIAVQNALKSDGYIIADSTTDSSAAIPVEVEIKQFWVWMDIGFWTVEIRMDVEINFKSPLALDGSDETVKGSYYMNSPAVVDSMFGAVVDNALVNLTDSLKTQLKKPNR